ncbi:MAG: DUF2178 domain-containing protein [Candidatus Methanomethylicaceae archaeon]|jgi:uncharacterized membrane protein
MNLKEYRRIQALTIFAMMLLVAYGVIQSDIFIGLIAVALGVIFLFYLGKSLTEVVHDERTVIIQNRAASATIAIITVSMTVIGLSLILLNWEGIGNYEQIGYLLAFQASFILILNTLLSYYYRKKLGG